MQRLGKNHGGYFGERIEIDAVLATIESAARGHRWTVEAFGRAGDCKLLALRGPPPAKPYAQRAARVYISAGIHGDEPAGPLAARRLLEENRWPPGLEVWLCPCLNPAGFRLNCRENAAGIDLNRQYLHPQAEETIAHLAWLRRQPGFDLCLCLHEDWESNGFYLYELSPDSRSSIAEPIIAHVSEVCPVDRAEMIEGRPAQNGIIRPAVDLRARRDWPEAFFLVSSKTRHSITLEAPSDFPLSGRVAALVTGVNTALEQRSAPGG
jgi:predicted deacylase